MNAAKIKQHQQIILRLVIDVPFQPLSVKLWRADTASFTPVLPERSPRRLRGIQQIVEAFANNIVKDVAVGNSSHFVPEEQPEVLMAEFRSFIND